jgi:hypothetical protein
MGWFGSKQKPSDNELGDYLPDGEAQLQDGYEPIQASGQKKADKVCEEVANEYGGTDAKAHPTDRKNEYDCRFKFWG